MRSQRDHTPKDKRLWCRGCGQDMAYWSVGYKYLIQPDGQRHSCDAFRVSRRKATPEERIRYGMDE